MVLAMKPLKSEPPRTQAFPHAGTKAMKPGMRALDACGDGFWECDLIGGSAWFSEWFYRKLGWPHDAKRSALCDLQPALRPGVWERLMGRFRDHLEKGFPLDLEIEVEVEVPGARVEHWHMRGAALRNSAGQPVYLAGSMREVSAAGFAGSDASPLACLGSAFEALPVAAAILDSHATVMVANQLWREFPEAIASQASARLRAANSQTAIEFWVDEGEGSGGRQLRVRAIAFQHEGARHLAVTLEDRRSD
jgi:hypothetical protein